MSIEGQLHIKLDCSAGRIIAVQIRSGRPLAAAQVFVGKTPEQLLTLMPMLYTICGSGQAFAALQALRQALGQAPDPVADTARQILVDVETLREHCWRILLDWPGCAGFETDKRQMAPFMLLHKEFHAALFGRQPAFQLDSTVSLDETGIVRQIDDLEALIEQAVFQGRLKSWKALQDERQLLEWLNGNESATAQLLKPLYTRQWCDIGRNAIERLPKLKPDELKRRLPIGKRATAFMSTPDWRGRCYETTVLNRQQHHPLIADSLATYGNGLLTRLLARLNEVASMPAMLRKRLAQLMEPSTAGSDQGDHSGPMGYGLAQVQAARGLLIHRLQLNRGRILDYAIVAPTEWNFHPGGVVAAGLEQLPADNLTVLRKQAEFLINAVDPCVRYELFISDAGND